MHLFRRNVKTKISITGVKVTSTTLVYLKYHAKKISPKFLRAIITEIRNFIAFLKLAKKRSHDGTSKIKDNDTHIDTHNETSNE